MQADQGFIFTHKASQFSARMPCHFSYDLLHDFSSEVPQHVRLHVNLWRGIRNNDANLGIPSHSAT